MIHLQVFECVKYATRNCSLYALTTFIAIFEERLKSLLFGLVEISYNLVDHQMIVNGSNNENQRYKEYIEEASEIGEKIPPLFGISRVNGDLLIQEEIGTKQNLSLDSFKCLTPIKCNLLLIKV